MYSFQQAHVPGRLCSMTFKNQGTDGAGVVCDSSNSCTTFASAAASNDLKPPFLADTDSNSPNRYGRGENALLRVRGPAHPHYT